MEDSIKAQKLLEQAIQLREQSEEIEKQLQFVNEQIEELNKINSDIKILKENKEKEILASLGRGVYISASRNNKEKLFVEVGAGIVVRKTPEEVMEDVEKQIIKFNDAHGQLKIQLESYALKFKKLLEEVEKLKN